jgi:MFS transporter, DHA2 family, multidrug resistance protein
MLGLVGSPVLGGVLIEHFSWHAIFFINIPVVAQFVLGYSPVKAGLAFVPLAVGALIGNAAGAMTGPAAPVPIRSPWT